MVEAQHRFSTMKLVDDPEEQATLEALLDATKPPVPDGCRHLHWLLFTPFRYEARSDSRFRRAGRTPPAFYAAEAEETALAEVAFWRLLFFIESPGTPFPANAQEFTAFAVGYATEACLDLTLPPHHARAEDWVHPTDYTACHAIADQAREHGCGAIRSRSARDPEGGANVTLLTCAAFANREPGAYRSWRLRLHGKGISAIREAPEAHRHFGRATFARDPRVTAFDWRR